MPDDDGMVPGMTEVPTLTEQLLDHLKGCQNRHDPERSAAHDQAIMGTELADMLVSAFKVRGPEGSLLYQLMETLAAATPQMAAPVIDALVTCVARADSLLQHAMERRAAMMEADPDLAQRMSEAFKATNA